MTRYFGRLALLFLLTMLAGASPVWAHHLMGGTTPSTFFEGLLSGLGHPIIGLDHLAFLIVLGVVVGIRGLNLLMPALFVGMSAIGVALHLNGVTVPAAEFLVASSLLVVGAMIARAARPALSVWARLPVFCTVMPTGNPFSERNRRPSGPTSSGWWSFRRSLPSPLRPRFARGPLSRCCRLRA